MSIKKDRDQRQHPRTPIQMSVLLRFEDKSTLTVETWDISDGGIGIHLPEGSDHIWTTGQRLTAQVQGLPVPAPEVPAKVVRIDSKRIGLEIQA